MQDALEDLERVKKCLEYRERRPFIEEALSQTEWGKTNLIIAPTGYGKTTITLSLFSWLLRSNEFPKGMAIYPLRALIEDQFGKARKIFSEKILARRYLGVHESPFLMKPITLTTIDLFSLFVLGLAPEEIWKIRERRSFAHFYFSMASVYLSSILVFDEVHLNFKLPNFISLLLSFLNTTDRSGTKVLLSATVSDKYRDFLAKNVQNLKIVEYKKGSDKEFEEERESKKYEPSLKRVKSKKEFCEFVLAELSQENWKRALIVVNTVALARKLYLSIRESFSEDVLLLHSLFRTEDKEAKLKDLEKVGIVVGTQCIEAGVDMSSDLFITEICRPDSLVQRFGRFLRGTDEVEGDCSVVWIEEHKQEGYYAISAYPLETIQETWRFLENNREKITMHLPEGREKLGYRKLLEIGAREIKIVPEFKLVPDPRTPIEWYQFTRTLLLKHPGIVREEVLITVLPEGDKRKLQEGIVEVARFGIPVSLSKIEKLKRKTVYKWSWRERKFEECNKLPKDPFDLGNFVVVAGEYDSEVGWFPW